MRPLFVLCVALVAPAALGSIAVSLTVEELAARADLVAVGRVARATVHWSTDHRHLYTRVTLALDERWKGEAGASVTVVVPGGELDGIGQEVVGEPRFDPGERVALFLRQRGQIYLLVGLSEGAFRVTGPPGAERAEQELRGLALAHRAPDGHLSIGAHGEGAEPQLSLARLRERVVHALGRGAVAPTVHEGASCGP